MNSSMNNKISIIICSLGNKSLFQTLHSIQLLRHKPFEVIVILQRSPKMYKNLLLSHFSKTQIYHLNSTGLSRARNFGISKAKGDIITFTDDDCIVHPDWTKNIYFHFLSYPHIMCISGSVYPYKPKNHPQSFCPCIITKTVRKKITKPMYHATHIGYGNNISFRKEIFQKIGTFKTWLGPGAIGQNADDAEMFLRILTNGYDIHYDPRIKVYHNKWLNPEEMQHQQLLYECGELACYGYYYFQGYSFTKPILERNIRQFILRYNDLFNLFIRWKARGLLLQIYHLFIDLYYHIKGISIGLLYQKVFVNN